MKIPKISTLMNSIDLFKKINDLIDVARMPLKRSTAYVVGDVVHVYSLPSYLYLECTQAGTTSLFPLNLSTTVGAELTDGTVKWIVRDMKGAVKSVNDIAPDTNGNVEIPAGEAIGFVSLCINGIIPAGWIAMLGSEYTRATYSDLYYEYAVANNLVISENEWQDLYAQQNGNVPYFSSGDGSTTFRTPSIRGWLKSHTIAGQYVEAGLPNIEGRINSNKSITEYQTGFENIMQDNLQGAFKSTVIASKRSISDGTATSLQLDDIVFNASDYNPIYGKALTVQPQGLTTFYIIKAFGVINNVGEADVAQLAQVTERVERELENIRFESNAHIRVIDKGESSDGTMWFRKWSDGWVEQGGIINGNTNVSQPITLIKTMADTNYNCWCQVIYNGNPANGEGNSRMFQVSTNRLAISTGVTNTFTKIVWNVCGKGGND